MHMKDTAINVLKILEESPGPISGERIAEQLGITRSAVWKQVRELRRLGYGIASSRAEGYRLESTTSKLLPYEIHKRLRTRFIGKQIRHFDRTASTSWVAKQLASETDPEKLHGMVIIAEEQTGGVGRLGRAWVSPARAIAIARAIRKEYNISALIKWPNDIFAGDKKVGGLLLELAAEADTVHYGLLGIGIDANISLADLPPNLKDTVTSLEAEVGHEVDRVALLARVLREFELRYQQLEDGEYDSIIREWKSLSLTLDQRVAIRTINKTFEGVAIDIDDHGALIIRKDNGRIERVIAGDCFQL